jgi:hypothetical protein
MSGFLVDQRKLKELQSLVARANGSLYHGEADEAKKLVLSECLTKVRKGLAEVQEAMFVICMEAGVPVPVTDFPHVEIASVRMRDYGDPQSIKTSNDVFEASGKTRAVKEDALALLRFLGYGNESNESNKRKRVEGAE